MYATRFADGPRFRPASMAAALAINGGVIAALLLAAPEIIKQFPDDPIDIIFIPKPIPSPPPPRPQPSPTARIDRPQPQPSATPEPGPSPDDFTRTVDTGPGTVPGGSAGGTGGGEVVADPPRPQSAFVGASFDPRYADQVEPPYPDAARDAGTEGMVRLRITIGADGRVKRADGLDGNAVLLRAAIRHVLAHWRFRPATLGGVAQESSKVMIVRFRLDT